jgi:hypothetical protein
MNIYTNVAMIRCAREHHELLWSALTLMTSVKGRNCLVQLLHLGGEPRIRMGVYSLKCIHTAWWLKGWQGLSVHASGSSPHTTASSC